MQTADHYPGQVRFPVSFIEPEDCASDGDAVIVPVRVPAQPTRSLFFVHGVGGGMFWGYENLARHLPAECAVYAFRCRAARGLPEHDTLEAMAAEYVAALVEAQPEGPYHLGGYCFGGNVAFEMARQLAAQGRPVGAVALFNSVPANCRYDQMRWTPVNTWKFIRNLGYWAVQLSTSRTARTSELLMWKWRTLCRKAALCCGWREGRRLVTREIVELAGLPHPSHAARWAAHLRAFYRFQPRAWSGRVLLLRTRGHQMFCNFDPDYGWGEFALGGVEVRVLPGEHESILQEPHVRSSAAALEEELTRVAGAGPVNTASHAQRGRAGSGSRAESRAASPVFLTSSRATS